LEDHELAQLREILFRPRDDDTGAPDDTVERSFGRASIATVLCLLSVSDSLREHLQQTNDWLAPQLVGTSPDTDEFRRLLIAKVTRLEDHELAQLREILFRPRDDDTGAPDDTVERSFGSFGRASIATVLGLLSVSVAKKDKTSTASAAGAVRHAGVDRNQGPSGGDERQTTSPSYFEDFLCL